MALKLHQHEVIETARRVRQAMKKQGLMVHQVARQTGITLSTVQAIANGTSRNPGIWTMQAIADRLEVPLAMLMGRQDGK
jgi:transcriptional regulator with XRE-family HTH domain